MAREKTTYERGQFKADISSALYKNKDIRELLLGDTTGKSPSEIQSAFKEQVKSHLFIDDTITDAKTFIFYDVRLQYMRNQIKTCQVIMYVMCHRNILETYSKEGYIGDRIDILEQLIEDTLINDDVVVNKFGIGALSLDSVDIYNALRFYGCIMTFSVPNFR